MQIFQIKLTLSDCKLTMQRMMCKNASVLGMQKRNAVALLLMLLTAQAVFSEQDLVKAPSTPPIIVNQAEEKGIGASSGSITPPKKPLTPPPYLQSLESTNEFDGQRKLWPDKVPPPPPLPPPPPPTPVTDQDVQVYGVVIVGQTKRATIKYGPRFASLNTSGKPFVTISEGQVIGEYTVTGIKPTYLVLTAPGGQQQLSFNRKMDRSAGGVQVVSTASGFNEIDPNAGANQQNQPQAAAMNDVAGKVPTSVSQTTVAPTPAPNADNALKNPAPGSLAAAIVAAQAAAQSTPPQTQNAPPPANFNPFLQLFPKQ